MKCLCLFIMIISAISCNSDKGESVMNTPEELSSRKDVKRVSANHSHLELCERIVVEGVNSYSEVEHRLNLIELWIDDSLRMAKSKKDDVIASAFELRFETLEKDEVFKLLNEKKNFQPYSEQYYLNCELDEHQYKKIVSVVQKLQRSEEVFYTMKNERWFYNRFRYNKVFLFSEFLSAEKPYAFGENYIHRRSRTPRYSYNKLESYFEKSPNYSRMITKMGQSDSMMGVFRSIYFHNKEIVDKETIKLKVEMKHNVSELDRVYMISEFQNSEMKKLMDMDRSFLDLLDRMKDLFNEN